jgi:hypothetical protein
MFISKKYLPFPLNCHQQNEATAVLYCNFQHQRCIIMYRQNEKLQMGYSENLKKLDINTNLYEHCCKHEYQCHSRVWQFQHIYSLLKIPSNLMKIHNLIEFSNGAEHSEFSIKCCFFISSPNFLIVGLSTRFCVLYFSFGWSRPHCFNQEICI